MTDQIREMAAIHCSMLASRGQREDDYPEHDAALVVAQVAAHRAEIDMNDPEWWRHLWAEAESMLRTGWEP